MIKLNKKFLKIALIIPVYRPSYLFYQLLESIKEQSLYPDEIVIVHSKMDTDLKLSIKLEKMNICEIDVRSFNHGGTRQMAIDNLITTDIAVFLTQDAVLATKDSLKNIIAAFNDQLVGCAYGRQLPHRGASVFAAHARLFNYPCEDQIKSLKDASTLGIKTVFISNSFAAYRISALSEVGGFPTDVILSEDTFVAAKMVLREWKVAYVAKAEVYHSHDYSIIQEFKRYFDIGVFYCNEKWIREKFGESEGEGKRFLISEIRYVFQNNKALLLNELVRTFLKYIGYRLAFYEKYIPLVLKKKLSMSTNYWNEDKL